MDQFHIPRAASSLVHILSSFPSPSEHSLISGVPTQSVDGTDASTGIKGPKRKRLSKACDACHKSKRRCDGTAPCSNCHYASKTCTYTDASGRPVPAPRPLNSERPDPPFPDSDRTIQSRHSVDGFFPPSRTPHPIGHVSSYSGSFQSHLCSSEDEHSRLRKRSRTDRDDFIPTVTPAQMEAASIAIEAPERLVLDHPLTRGLVNLFFAHCHPQRMIIHKPSFSSALSHNRVPSHLLQAVCALAAPLSKQTRIRTKPPHLAGRPFAQEAVSIMFDSTGRLICKPDLSTAQALCLLQMHELVSRPSWNTRYHDLALQIVENLGVHKPDDPAPTAAPSPEFIEASIERECVRRIFWLIRLVDLMSAIYFKRPVPNKDRELTLRLPVDETSFELAVHSTHPEYLYLQAPRTQYASEFGPLIHVVSIYSKVEAILDVFNGSESVVLSNSALVEAEQALDAWASSLPDQLRFSKENLQEQLSMFETCSNTDAWCFCCMHVMHASCVLALNLARQRGQRGAIVATPWAIEQLDMIILSMGGRAQNSIILGAALWTLLKYCRKEGPQVTAWSAKFEEVWGIRVEDLISFEWRPQAQGQQQHSRVIFPSSSTGSNPIPIPTTEQEREPLDSMMSYNHHRLSINSASSSYPSLRRSLDELHIHSNRPGSSSSMDDSGSVRNRTVNANDVAEIDPMFRNGPLLRGLEGPQSLPSLKASGLLDSWTGPQSPVTWMGHHQQSSSSSSSSPTNVKSPTTFVSESSRTSLSSGGLPVGLRWLADESR